MHRILASVLAVGVVVAGLAAVPATALTSAAPTADPSARDPLTLAQQRLDATRAEATDISGKISAAQSEQARLANEIADAERRIPSCGPRRSLCATR